MWGYNAFYYVMTLVCVKPVRYHHGIARSKEAGVECLQTCSVEANILDSRQGMVIQFGIERGASNFSHKETSLLPNVPQDLGIGRFVWNGISNGKWH
jgi:hypothetical protein